MDIQLQLAAIAAEAERALAGVSNPVELAELKAKVLGKKGPFAEFMTHMKSLSNEERPRFGALVNEAKNAVTALFEDKRAAIDRAAIDAKLAGEAVDVTLPGRLVRSGARHLLTRTIEEIEKSADIDAVIICTPTDTHADLIEQLAREIEGAKA